MSSLGDPHPPSPPPPPHAPNIFPFMDSFNMPNLICLAINPILHDTTLLDIPTKFPSNIHKFEGQGGEDPTNRTMNFHLWWASSNNIKMDHLKLILL